MNRAITALPSYSGQETDVLEIVEGSDALVLGEMLTCGLGDNRAVGDNWFPRRVKAF